MIQYNIDLLNETGTYYTENLRYRDELTEGYNITPNFFIYGYINNFKDFDNDELNEKGKIVKSFHFEDRLFDRDTLFVHQYKINFYTYLKATLNLGNKLLENLGKKLKADLEKTSLNFSLISIDQDLNFMNLKKKISEILSS